jgi:pilus assembly protein Flp/PilA
MLYLSNLLEHAFAWFESRDERGAAGVEYGLLVALIAAVIVATVATLGTQVESGFQTVVNNLP